MGLATVYSRAQVGLNAPLVTVEVHVAGGLPAMSIVGLPEAAVRESRDRVRAALQNNGFSVPPRRITINLAPADLPKEGGRFDLPIAIGILVATGQVGAEKLGELELLGELSLGGELRPVAGVLNAVLASRDSGRQLIVPLANGAEAALVRQTEPLVAETLLQVTAQLAGGAALAKAEAGPEVAAAPVPDLADVRGQAHARRALEIAAAGNHNLLLIGPPGSGKSMLASRLPGLLPPLSEEEAIASAAVRSAAGNGVDAASWKQRPFRSPHHSASAVALVGGGSNPRPGEISLAHHGVLFLDELPEFDRNALEVLREPLETGEIQISRAARSVTFPANFLLVAAMNPCPAGGCSAEVDCRCTAEQVARYRGKLSGPLLDRIDLHVEVPAVPVQELIGKAIGENSASVAARVATCRSLATQRQQKPNALLTPAEVDRYCALAETEQQLIATAIDKLGLSARGYHRILRVARTIADLAGADDIGRGHLSEAIGYRKMERLPAGLRR